MHKTYYPHYRTTLKAIQTRDAQQTAQILSSLRQRLNRPITSEDTLACSLFMKELLFLKSIVMDGPCPQARAVNDFGTENLFDLEIRSLIRFQRGQGWILTDAAIDLLNRVEDRQADCHVE
jgi:hypothetical protein